MRMKTRWFFIACVCAAIALAAAFFLVRSARHKASAQQAQSAPLRAAQAAPADSAPMLLPELSDMHITALHVSTPERSFQFHLDQHGSVSVNGQQADVEVFSTLLEQIEKLPAEQRSAFQPQAQNLILTLVISADHQEQTVRFYDDGHTGEKAHILLGSAETPEYRQTNAWHVGKLMMTCEGTRILDIHGNETPAAK